MMLIPSSLILLLLAFCDFCETRTVYACRVPQLKNGKVRVSNRNRIVKYICNPGYIRAGDRVSFCKNNKWDTSPPVCVRQGCRAFDPPANCLIYSSHWGAVYTFTCKPHYQLRGKETIYCDGVAWSAQKPTCIATNSKPQLSCDFESTDLCGWTHDLNHDFDWLRMSNSTPSGIAGTGPSFDHTKGRGNDGHYMYLESTSQYENDTTRLISPIYDRTSAPICFEFFYHMYGRTVGTLRVYVKTVNESWTLERSKAFFERSGNHGDVWLKHVQLFGPIDEDFQIIIEGIRGKGYASDIAIDDVKIVPNCSAHYLQDEYTSTSTEYYETTELLDNASDFKPDDFVSCQDRCYQTNFTITNHRYCACDENCYDRNECCPDFYYFCVIAPSGESSSSSTIENVTEEISARPPLIKLATVSSTKILETQPTHKTTTTTKRPTTTTTKRPTTTTTNTPKVTLKTTEATIKSTVKATTSKMHVSKSTKAITEIPNITAKTTTMISNEIQQTFPDYSEEKPDVSANSDEEPHDLPPDMIAPEEFEKRLSMEYNQKIIVSQPRERPTDWTTPLVGILIVTAILVGATVASKKFALVSRFKSNRFRSPLGESQSDVRFLTSDEILNFNVDDEDL